MIVGYVRQILGSSFKKAHPWAALKGPILNRVNRVHSWQCAEIKSVNDVAETDGANNIQPENTKEEHTIGEVLLSQSKEEVLNTKLCLLFFINFLFFHQIIAFQKFEKYFLLHLKSSFCTKDIQIFVIFPFLSTLSRFKRTNRSGIIYDVMNWLA